MTYQTAISKLLMLMEKGEAAAFKGKSLNQIEINLEDEMVEVDEMSEEETENDLIQAHASNAAADISSCKGKGRSLVKWTTNQKGLTKQFFENHIKNKIPPKKGECEELKSKNPTIFDNKTWSQIKVFVQNIYRR